MVLTKTLDAYHIGSSLELTDDQLRTLIFAFNRPARYGYSILSGRRLVNRHQINGIGSVIIKYYTRGGFIRYLIKNRYLKLGKIRGQKEFELLQKVRKIGIYAPEPIAFAYQGKLFYRCWLISREIKQAVSLAELNDKDQKRIQIVMRSLLDQICTLIQHKIYHVDLHPGNVVVDRENRVFLVDFDKGYVFSGSKNRLRNCYLGRWRRAVKKYDLPAILNDMMCSGLNLNFEK